VFEWSTGDDQSPLTVTETKRTETQAISGTPLTLLGDLLDVDVPTENADIALDFGSSTFAIDVGGVVTAGQTMPDGSPCRWGDGSGDVGEATQTDAEGCSPHVKMAVFGEWLRHSRQSSIRTSSEKGAAGRRRWSTSPIARAACTIPSRSCSKALLSPTLRDPSRAPTSSSPRWRWRAWIRPWTPSRTTVARS